MSEPTLPPFNLQLNTGRDTVRTALHALLGKLKPLDLNDLEVSTVEIVLAEVLNNIMEHAFSERRDDGTIAITCAHETDGLHLEITDNGHPMPDGRVPLGSAPNLRVPQEDLPEGGFGWLLIKQLSKDIAYTRQGEQNRLTLRLAVGLVP